MSMLKRAFYIVFSFFILLFIFQEYIELETYGQLHTFILVLEFIGILFLLIASILLIRQNYIAKNGKWLLPVLQLLLVIIGGLIFIFRPIRPHVGVTYKEIWVWEGWYNSTHTTKDVFSIFDAKGTLKLSNNGKFILYWRSLFKSGNYYGEWNYQDNLLLLHYHGPIHKRIGTTLKLIDGKLYCYNEVGDFAPGVILIRQ